MKLGRKKFSDEYLLEKLREASALLGRSVSRTDMRNLCKAKKGFPCGTVYEVHFGSWNNAKKLAELPALQQGWRTGRNPNNRNATLRLRFEVFQRDNFRCRYCGRTPREDSAKLVVDHILPFSKGGKTVKDNLITSCSECNAGKKDVILGQKKGASQ